MRRPFPRAFLRGARILSAVIGATIGIGLTGCFADNLQVRLASQSTVEERLRAGLVSPKERQNATQQLFTKAGCPATEQQVDKHSGNILCTLIGETNATIVVGGHFDFTEHGRGIVDDWSGTSLLVSLYETLKQDPRRHTFEFVAFAAEERGLIGSSQFVKALTPEQRGSIRAFINLERLGLTPPKVWVHRSTPILVARLVEIANAVHIPSQAVNVEKVGDDDTHPFFSNKIPVISIHSITQNTWGVIHSERDNIEAVHPDVYYDAYRLLAFYLAYLDFKMQ